MRYFHVILGKKHIDLVLAKSKEHAIEQVRFRFGPAQSLSTIYEYKAIEA